MDQGTKSHLDTKFTITLYFLMGLQVFRLRWF